MGIPIFLIFAPKHRLWVFNRTASAIHLYQKFSAENFQFLKLKKCLVLSKHKKKYQKFSAGNFQFFKLKKSLYIAWASFRDVDVIYSSV